MINHKGTWCIYQAHLFCQEGLCYECQIWLDKMRDLCLAEMEIEELTSKEVKDGN